MSLIKSISGIRGTIGDIDGLHPTNVVNYSLAFATVIKNKFKEIKPKIVVGRDGRISGNAIKNLVINSIVCAGVDVYDADYSTTPSMAMGVTYLNAQAGIMITASHNPQNWNALKFFNDKGEFITEDILHNIEKIVNDSSSFSLVKEESFGQIYQAPDLMDYHIKKILELPYINKELIRQSNFKIVVDTINSTGSIAIRKLFDALGIDNYILINDDVNGVFEHSPEPLPENLSQLSFNVKTNKADVGFAVDPDVDRLAIVCDNGDIFGEEYTIVAIADYILENKPGPVVVNLSTTQAVKFVADKYNCPIYYSAVGEINVVNKMKEVGAVIGGEGNGGVILPELHYGRDAILGIALFLSFMAKKQKPVSVLKSYYPYYHMIKSKIDINNIKLPIPDILKEIQKRNSQLDFINVDGLKLTNNDDTWIHLRPSNTEPIIRIYIESSSKAQAEKFLYKIMQDLNEIIQ
jgi:phosphomannomutase